MFISVGACHSNVGVLSVDSVLFAGDVRLGIDGGNVSIVIVLVSENEEFKLVSLAATCQ